MSIPEILESLAKLLPTLYYIYLSIFLYVLTPEGDTRRVPVNQVLGVGFLFFLCNVSCVSSEWEKPVLALWCWAPSKVATGTIFNAFGMARPGFEPATSRSRSGRSTTWAVGTGLSWTVDKQIARRNMHID